MPSGLLKVAGTISLSQFWPMGTSDADTSKIIVDTTGHPFQYRPHPGAPFKDTAAFVGATVVGAVRKPAMDKNCQIVVRLQGIDAPELHYRPKALLGPTKRSKVQDDLYLKWNHEYRQYLGETATISLAAFLASTGQTPAPCRVESSVDEPGEVFDTYGRFVGDIFVTVGGHELNLNSWLLQQGWAFPAFYTSMSTDEITRLTDDTNVAYEANTAVWQWLNDYADALEWALVFRKKGSIPDPSADRGGVVVPKIFRRLSTWAVNKRAKMYSGTFLKYLKAHSDLCYETKDFLLQGPTASTPRRLDEFIDSDGYFSVWPEERQQAKQ
jgi:endonuclease YncB( thermonuclease family)